MILPLMPPQSNQAFLPLGPLISETLYRRYKPRATFKRDVVLLLNSAVNSSMDPAGENTLFTCLMQNVG